MHSASLSIPCPPAEAGILHDALAIEAGEGPEGTTTTIARSDDGLSIDVTAGDVSGLRAALHSVLRLMDAARRTLA